MKKIKEEKQLDYMRMPDDIWERHLNEFLASINDIDQRLQLAGRILTRLEKAHTLATK